MDVWLLKIIVTRRLNLALKKQEFKPDEILILDEPTAHLDLKNAFKVFSLLKQKSKEEGKTILLASHNIHLSKTYSDRVVFIKSAQILADIKTENQDFTNLMEEAFELSGDTLLY